MDPYFKKERFDVKYSGFFIAPQRVARTIRACRTDQSGQ